MEGFVTGNRYKYTKVTPCCGRDNKDGKFAPFKGQDMDGEARYGHCHSCGVTSFPPSEHQANEIGYNSHRQNFIDPSEISKSQEQIKHDTFYNYLITLWDSQTADQIFKENNIGTSADGTVFWLVDSYGKVCQPKTIRYNPDGKRSGGIKVHPDYTGEQGYYPCAFNEVGLLKYPEKVVGLVESEKTAAICNKAFPNLIWVASGGANGLSGDKAHALRDRDVLIFYDADDAGRTNAVKATELLKRNNCNVKAVDLFPDLNNGFDLADFTDAYLTDIFNWESVDEKIKEHISTLSGKDEYSQTIYRFGDQREYLIERFISGDKAKGITTHFKELDTYFKWVRGAVGSWTGYAASGKSELLLQLTNLKSKKSGWRWMLFMPESMSSNQGKISTEAIGDTLAHTYIGKSTNIKHPNAMSKGEYEEAMDYIQEHFVVVYPKNKLYKPKDLIYNFEFLINADNKGFDGCVIDPWNHLISDINSQELIDEYIRREISALDHMSIAYDLCTNVVVHPNAPRRNKNDEFPKADAFSLRGGAAWNNGSFFINSVHRPDWFKELVPAKNPDGTQMYKEDGTTPLTYTGRNSPLVEFHQLKMKEQKVVQTIYGKLDMHFNRKTNRYTTTQGVSPFDDGYADRVEFTPQPEVEQKELFDELPF